MSSSSIVKNALSPTSIILAKVYVSNSLRWSFNEIDMVSPCRCPPFCSTMNASIKGATTEGKGGAPTESQGKKGKRGRNKKRPKDQRPPQGDVLCPHVSDGRACTFGERFVVPVVPHKPLLWSDSSLERSWRYA